MDDGGQLCLDWVLEDGDDADVTPNKPTVIIFHGLNGGSSSVYVVYFACPARVSMILMTLLTHGRQIRSSRHQRHQGPIGP